MKYEVLNAEPMVEWLMRITSEIERHLNRIGRVSYTTEYGVLRMDVKVCSQRTKNRSVVESRRCTNLEAQVGFEEAAARDERKRQEKFLRCRLTEWRKQAVRSMVWVTFLVLILSTCQQLDADQEPVGSINQMGVRSVVLRNARRG